MAKIIKNFIKKMIYHERSPEKLALSFSMGTYIAFSPFMGFHTVMVFLFTWIFGLNLGVTLASSCFINNPWTMIPVYSAGYGFGYWMMHNLFNINTIFLEPAWMMSVNNFFEHTIGFAKPCLWSFLVGGNILGIALGLFLYPLMKRIFAHYVAAEFGTPYENNYTK